jgi:hypothetical protein
MLGAMVVGRKTSEISLHRWRWLPLWDFDDLPQQLANEGYALAALGFFPQRTINRRDGAAFALGLAAKVAIGDPVADTNVHARTQAPSAFWT